MSLTSLGIALLVLVSFVAVWYVVIFVLSPHLEDPDGYAKITGNCGDTMEIAFKVDKGVITDTHHWASGCSLSAQCAAAAAMLALSKKPTEIRAITMVNIMDQIGKIPDTHLHCAQLAETTLQKALDDYLAKCAA